MSMPLDKAIRLEELSKRVITATDRAIRSVDKMLATVEQSEARMRALKQRPIKLSKRDTETVLRILANPPKPNQHLRRAAEAYMKRGHF